MFTQSYELTSTLIKFIRAAIFCYLRRTHAVAVYFERIFKFQFDGRLYAGYIIK